ncbi:MAG: hypothetical protein AB9866_10840 [Syntrophobacteraceae bacterium]
MGTIIRLTDVEFSNSALPVISPLVTNGLIGAFRPGTGLVQSAVDLSGNGHVLTVKGNPSFTAQGVLGSLANGLVTDIAETLTLSVVTVGRYLRGADGQYLSCFLAGCYSSDSDGVEYSRRGSCVYFSAIAGTGEGLKDLRLNGQTYGLRLSDGLMINISSGYTFHDEIDPAGLAASDWVFCAVTVDAPTRLVYVPRYSQIITNVDPELYDIDQRHLVNPTGGAPNLMAIGTPFPGAAWSQDGRVEVAEALFYNRALTEAEVLEQYAYSQAFMANIRGITI